MFDFALVQAPAPSLYSPSMIYQIYAEVFREIRVSSDLGVNELAGGLGRKRQTVTRIEGGKQIASLEQEAILVEKANLSRKRFVEIMCKVLSKFLGMRVMIVPELRYMPTSILEVGARLFNRHQEKIDLKVQQRIKAKLLQARSLEATTDLAVEMHGQEILGMIEEALAARGEKLTDFAEE